MNRREFITKSAEFAAYTAFGMAAPVMFKETAVARRKAFYTRQARK
jgi:hypothetical protein